MHKSPSEPLAFEPHGIPSGSCHLVIKDNNDLWFTLDYEELKALSNHLDDNFINVKVVITEE